MLKDNEFIFKEMKISINNDLQKVCRDLKNNTNRIDEYDNDRLIDDFNKNNQSLASVLRSIV